MRTCRVSNYKILFLPIMLLILVFVALNIPVGANASNIQAPIAFNMSNDNATVEYVNTSKEEIAVTPLKALEDGVVIRIAKISENDLEKRLIDMKLHSIYRIGLVRNDTTYTSRGEFSVKILIPSELKKMEADSNKEFFVYHFYNNVIDEVKYTIEGDYISFNIDELADFAIVTSAMPVYPNCWLYDAILLVVLILLLVVLNLIKNKIRSKRVRLETMKTNAYITPILVLLISDLSKNVSFLLMLVLLITIAVVIVIIILKLAKLSKIINEIKYKEEYRRIKEADNAVENHKKEEINNSNATIVQKDSFESEDVEEYVDEYGVFKYKHYDYSFLARLALADEETKGYYKKLVQYLQKFDVKRSYSWKHERIYSGKRTYAKLLFKDDALCVAYAMNPEDIKDEKFKIVDFSDVKRFENTPVLTKITGIRRLTQAKELLKMCLKQYGIKEQDVPEVEVFVESKTKEALIEEELIKVYETVN